MDRVNGYRIFDAHTHAFPDKIAEKTIQLLAGQAGIPYYHDGSFAGLEKYEAEGGADAFLLLPIATKPASVRSINEWVAARTGGGVFACGSVHPDCGNVQEELDHLLELGLLGVKLHPEYQEFFVDEERMFPVYEAIFERNLPIYFHAGPDVGFPPPVRAAADRLAKVAEAFPQGRIIAAHMGSLYQTAEVLEHLAGRPNVWMDTSFSAERMSAEEIVTLVRWHGADRFFFGTDAPWADFAAARDALLSSGLTRGELEKIFWHNAAEFFRLSPEIK